MCVLFYFLQVNISKNMKDTDKCCKEGNNCYLFDLAIILKTPVKVNYKFLMEITLYLRKLVINYMQCSYYFSFLIILLFVTRT